MRHEVFGLFDDTQSASAALTELKQRSDVGERCSFVVHRDAIEGEATDPHIAHHERGLRESVRFGGLLGAVGSAAALALLEGPLRLVGAGPAFAALVGAGAGTAAGAAIGAIAGSGWGDTNFQKLVSHLRKGSVLVSVNVDGLTSEHEVEDILRRNGASTTHRATF